MSEPVGKRALRDTQQRKDARGLYAAGDRVSVSWMGGVVDATVYRVDTRKNGLPYYRLTIDGIQGHPWYHHAEITPACCVCDKPGHSQHSEPGGGSFWLCGECVEACAAVGREGQY